MKHNTKFVGLDVSKEKIAVAIADEGRESPRFWGTTSHKKEAVRKLMKRLGAPESLQVCYEAGPTGYMLYRWLTEMGIACTIIAPSLIPTRPGDRVKTDRRDAIRLAQLFRAGELIPVHVPDEEAESLRDLTRALEDAKDDLHRARQRIIKFLLRRQIAQPPSIRTRWTKAYHCWLETLSFGLASDRIVFREYLHAIFECEERVKRLDAEISEQADQSLQAPVIQALQALRGISTRSAFTIANEVVTFTRFGHPANLMAYTGLVPRERSSGASSWRGGLTKAGNAHLRRVLIEAAWSYRYPPAVKGDLKKRLEGQNPDIQQISWQAQNRLHKKFRHLVIQKGKHPNTAVAAIARELVGFIWAIAREAEMNQGKLIAKAQ